MQSALLHMSDIVMVAEDCDVQFWGELHTQSPLFRDLAVDIGHRKKTAN